MQTLRKKTSPLKYKNETTKFLGDGVSFKAKLIGILEVSEARGDRMCQEALSDLKMAIRAAGEHKQRITVNIAIDGLRLRDEKTGDCLYHHPVHKISFIAQDMTDSRAFGYIFGSPDTGHRFFGIKTDKAASQVVIAMRDLFQVVFSLKKKEIELAKQHLEKTYLPSSPLFSDTISSTSKILEKTRSDTKGPPTASEVKGSGTAVADLVDLELELNNLQQGLSQMEKITPSNPYGSKDDPFGDSFVYHPVSKLILPPPPSSGRERSNRTTDVNSIFSPKTPHIIRSLDEGKDSVKELNESFPFSNEFTTTQVPQGDWFSETEKFEEHSLVPPEPIKDEKHEMAKKEIMSQFDVFTELDPLELKNPPKKALNDLVPNNSGPESLTNSQDTKGKNIYSNTSNVFTTDPFGEDPFVKEDPFASSDFSKQDPFNSDFGNSNFGKGLSRSPKYSSTDMEGSSPKILQNIIGPTFEKFSETKVNNLSHLDNPNLDISSGSESTPEPPPRPSATLSETRPPPLPPKKLGDLVIKPPPRPPHIEENSSDYMEIYDSIQTNFKGNSDKGPPLPPPQRKSRFDSELSIPSEALKHKLNPASSDEDYLTPISFPEKPGSSEIFLPPPQRNLKKEQGAPIPAKNTATDSLNNSIEDLDISLSQLTLSGLNELATKLNIPSSQLSNMPLVQLANYISNFIKSKSKEKDTSSSVDKFPTFQADFAANFSNNNATSVDTVFDKYAVFRELQEEIEQTKQTAEPEKIEEENVDKPVESEAAFETNLVKPTLSGSDDKYAALRDIVPQEQKLEEDEDLEDIKENHQETIAVKETAEGDDLITKEATTPQKEIISKDSVIEFATDIIEKTKFSSPEKSPLRSPARSPAMKSPIENVSKEMMTNIMRTSGSLSDIVSGSSPEIDNTGSNSDIPRKGNVTGESWAVFDQPGGASESQKENLCTGQSEEGVSPWSSDSKEFGNGSPPDWRKNPKEGKWKDKRDQEGWWDTSAEPEVYNPTNRRSTDSYEDEYYECYDRPQRRRRQAGGWQHSGRQTAGGHSSSSRDVSPWEEEPTRREAWQIPRQRKGHSFERHREMKHVDSWDDDDDYEYDDEHRMRCHYFDRCSSKDSERHSGRETENDRWGENWSDDRRYRKRREGRESSAEFADSKEKWCCVDWKRNERDIDKSRRYVSARRSNIDRRDRHDERYRSKREAQESPWEDEYFNEPEEAPSRHYLLAKRNWKQRPSSASEMERKTGELKRPYLGTGGSDGEKERRLKGTRRSRSRDSQYESHRHKPESSLIRSQYRTKHHSRTLEADYSETTVKKISPEADMETKRPISMSKKKIKDDGVSRSSSTCSTFPRKSCELRTKSVFENEFQSVKKSSGQWQGNSFNFEAEFGTSKAESVHSDKSIKGIKSDTSERELIEVLSEKLDSSLKVIPKIQPKPRSPFEDDFSPTEKATEGNGISSIKEETDFQEEEEEDRFSSSGNRRSVTEGRTRKLTKYKLSSGKASANLKKSDSVNIFSMENDPFDDEFFSGMADERASPKDSDYSWTEHFKEYDSRRK